MKASPGQNILTTALGSAAFCNNLVDMVDWWKRTVRGDPKRALPVPIPTDVIKVKNVSGVDRSAGQVLELGTHLWTDVDRRNIGFRADTVSHTSGRSYCILPRPIPSNEIDDAHIAGVCVAKVDIQATTDRYAYVTVSSNILKSGEAGQFKLLGPVTATGEHSVAVTFADDGRPFCFGQTPVAVAKGATGTFTIYDFNGTTEFSTGRTIQAKALGSSINALKWVFLFWFGGRWYAACWE